MLRALGTLTNHAAPSGWVTVILRSFGRRPLKTTSPNLAALTSLIMTGAPGRHVEGAQVDLNGVVGLLCLMFVVSDGSRVCRGVQEATKNRNFRA